MIRLLARLALMALAWWGLGPGLQAAEAATRPPVSLDCAQHPCGEVLPAAVTFRPVEGAPYWEGLDAAGDTVGWVALSTDLVDVKAYSGKPLVTLVGLSPEGTITGARIIHHSEPILLIGIPEHKLHDFVAFYKDLPALQRVVVGRARQADAISVDVISGATVTVLAQNLTILETARKLGVSVGVFSLATVRRGHFVSEDEPWTFPQMLERGALGHLLVTAEEMGLEDSDEPYIDLYFGIADAPQVGRSLLGEREYEYQMKKLAEGEHLLAVLNRGTGSFKGSAFVRGGIFDRVRLQQGLREITFRDTDYDNLPDSPAEGAPEFNEGAIFVLREGRFDPSAPYELIFLGSRYDHRGAFTRDFREFTARHALPKSIYVAEAEPTGIPWRQAWLNRSVEVAVLVAYLLAVVGVFLARRFTTADPQRIKRLHIASLAFAFLVVGVAMRAQPSVTQIFTATDGLLHEWRWSLFLSEPMIFTSWIFIMAVTLYWGRGVFCGWVCPYGAMTELWFKIGQKLGIRRRGYELPESVHQRLRYLRYVVLVVLVSVFLWDSIAAERLAEVEPFKSTFLVPFWTRHWGFSVWWLLLMGASLFTFRPFCRYLCPLGGGLALLSSFRPSGPRRRVFCSSCKICTRGCEPRAFRADGSIDPRECLSCMDCEATYRNAAVCPPLLGIANLESQGPLSERQKSKLATLRSEAEDL
jgi:NosR/NirI family nitrous oxide reductase transcriptional regulator